MRRNFASVAVSSAIALGVMLLSGWSARPARAEESQIETLARRHFPEMQLTDCEKNLLEHVSTGEVAYCGPSHSEKDKVPEETGEKRMQFDVDAELIRWLCVDPAATKLVDPKGIRIHAARIVGQLDLSFTTVSFPLDFQNSRFARDINLAHGQLTNVDLTGSQTRGIMAYNVIVRGDVVLSNGFSAEGQVDLAFASLGANLECDGGQFKNPGSYALLANGLKAAGTIFLREASAEGEVNLMLADLVGNLECDGGKFKNPGKYALSADSLKAKDVFLRNGFSAEGEVNLVGADLGGNLECDGGQFKNPGKYALNADSLKAKNVDLRNGFSAEGEVNLILADLGGDLDCHAGKFKNPGKYALNADSLKVAGNVFLRNASADGAVSLVGADLGGSLDCDGGQFKNPGNYALNADSLKAKNVDLRNGFSAEGEVTLTAANIKGALIWMNLSSEHADQVVLDLRHATVGPFFDDENSWPKEGNLKIDGFVYSRIGGGPTDARSRLSWLDRQRPKDNRSADFTPQPYEQLAKVLREDGDDAGAKSVLIAMENARWWYGKIGFWDRCWSWILWVTIGYGYDTWRVLWFIGGFVIAGTVLFFWGHKSGVITQTDKDNPEHSRPFNPFVYSLETFLPLVDLHQSKSWAPDPQLRVGRPKVPIAPFKPLSKYQHQFGSAFGKHLRWYLWLHILAGWFFTSMLIAGISGLVQKG